MSQNFVELKEPLISNNSKEKLNKDLLKSFLEDKYSLKKFQREETQNVDKSAQDEKHSDNESLHTDSEHPCDVSHLKVKDASYVHPLIDFKAELKNLIEQPFAKASQHKEFYMKATANHEMPNLQIQKLTIQKNNPKIFAVLSEPSQLFNKVEVKEFICFEDYKRLSKIRIRNYVSLLRMLSKIDSSQETYQKIKLKLYQVKKLSEYLGLKLDVMYNRLHRNDQIHDLTEENQLSRKPSEDQTSSKEQNLEAKEDNENENSEAASQDDAIKSNQDQSEEQDEYQDTDEEENEDDQDDGDQEYLDFFKESKLQISYDYELTHELLREEELWASRAEWLDKMLEDLQEKEETKAWVPWFKAKLDELADLDIPIKNAEASHNSQIFYLYDFLEEQAHKFNPKAEYQPDQKVYPEENNVYPAIIMDQYNINQGDPSMKLKFNVREKLCNKFVVKEKQTDLIITVFERKAFGNEKIYERRINLRGKNSYVVQQFEIHPNGGYIFLNLQLESLENMSFGLIFAMDAQYKDPKVIKSNFKYLGFYDKYFYALYHNQKVRLDKVKNSDEHASNKKKSKKKSQTQDDLEIVDMEIEGQQEKQNELDQQKQIKAEEENFEEISRVFEYDLTDFSKVKYCDLRVYGSDLYWYNLGDPTFGKLKDGFFFREQKMESDYKSFQFIYHIRSDIYKMESSDKIDNTQGNADSSQMTINEKGDKALLQYWKDGQLQFMRYYLDPKDKKIKKDNELKLKSEQLTIKKDDCDIKVYSVVNDYVILIKNTKVGKIFVFLNENLITQVKAEFEEFSFVSNEKGLQSIVIQRESDTEFYEMQNSLKYLICDLEIENDKKSWVWNKVQFDIYNRNFDISYPYAFCIYNHDQVIIKDLTKRTNQGYYYMNNFLAINKGSRPLTIFGQTYNNKTVINVPIIQSSYTKTDFNLRIAQIKSRSQVTDSFKLHGMLRYRQFSFNQDVLSYITSWSGVLNSKNKLHHDIRIQSKHNSLYIEQWVKGKCDQRLVISYYHSMVDRNIDIQMHTELKYRSYGQWLILYQKIEGQQQSLQLYTHEMKYHFSLSDVLQMDTIWDYDDDDTSNEIHGVYFDTLVQGKISIYVMFTNCLLRKFTSTIPEQNSGVSLQFDEAAHPYNLDYIFKGKQKDQNDEKSANSKRINLYEQNNDIFISNNVLYSQSGIVDLSTENIENRCYTGTQIQNLHISKIEESIKITSSYNEARLAFFINTMNLGTIYSKYRNQLIYEESDYEPLCAKSVMLLTLPLLNSRVIPQFDHRRFNHPIMPIIDQQKTCASVFTLNLHPQMRSEWNRELRGPQYFARRMKDRFVDLSPGLLIKYFNGIEEKVPFHLFGEEFIDILRIKQSSNGEYLTLVGTRIGKLEDRFYDQKYLENTNYHQGIFIYKVAVNSIKLVKSLLFAIKDFENDQRIDSFKLSYQRNPSKFERILYQEAEIQGTMVGEYSNDYIANDGDQHSQEILDEINYLKEDKEYVEKLRIKHAIALREKFILEEQRSKSLLRSMTKGNYNTQTNRDSLRENLLNNSEHTDYLSTSPKVNHDGMDDMDYRIQVALDQLYPRPTSFEHMKILKEGLNFPYLQESSTVFLSALQARLDIQTAQIITKKGIDESQCFEYEEEKMNSMLFTSSEYEKLKKIHANMILDVNEQGHVFLIDRISNSLTFYYPHLGDYVPARLKFDPDFILTGADSSAQFLVVTGKEKLDDNTTAHRYKVFSIVSMLEDTQDSDHRFTYDLDRLEKYCLEYDSKINESKDVELVNLGSERYIYEIEDCKVLKELLILQIYDNSGTRYLKIFDMKAKVLTYYLEGQKYQLSGCKQFVWIKDTNQVYDIYNGLSTFFLWPGDQINTHAYDAMAGFNINEDRTLMVSQGMVQLAFNYISFEIDDQLEDHTFLRNDSKYYKSGSFSYLCFKIGHYKSILEKIFKTDYEKISKKDYLMLTDEQIRDQMDANIKQSDDDKRNTLLDHQIHQNKQIQNFLQFLQERFTAETLDYNKVSLFFFTYYYSLKTQKRNTILADPPPEYKFMNIFWKMYSQKLDKRIDLIEDILHYVVEQKTIPILQSVINSCFVDFLRTANTSVAFQSYLNDATVQTQRMQEIEKFQITSSELGFVTDSHVSPIMDDKFQSKFRVPKETKKDVEITYITLGKLLSEQGEEIMEMLSESKYLSIMDIPFIKYLVMYQWLQIKHTIHRRLLYPFFVMLGMFTIYCLLIDFKDVQEDHDLYEEIFRWIFTGIISPVLGYFFYVEIDQLIKDPSDYFNSFWNFSDLISYTLCLLVVIFDRIPQIPPSVNRPIASVCLIILWIKLFYFLRVFESTSRLIRMIIEIVNDMKNFLMVLTIGIIGFSGGFFILAQGEAERTEKPGVFMSILDGYRLAMGDFQLDSFSSLNTADQILAWFLFVIGSLFLVIVLLNLLIAIMGDTFSRVLENITNLSVREKVMLVSENESLFNRQELFKNAQFLIVINEKNLDSVQTDNWDGQINAFKRQIMDRVNNLHSDIDNKLNENQKDLKKRINDQDEKARKQGTAQELRMQAAFKNEFIEAITKINDQFVVQTKLNQTLFTDQMKTIKLVQDQVEQLKQEQQNISQLVTQALNQNNKNIEDQ